MQRLSRPQGTEVPRAQNLPRIVARHAPGSTVKVTFLRDRATKTVDITLDALREQANNGEADGDDEGGSSRGSAPSPGLGLSLGDSVDGGAEVRRVTPGSDASEELRPGDVIVEVNRVRVANADEAVKQMRATPAGEPVLLKVKSREGNRTRYVAIERK
jgi:serine protease Do